MPLKIILSALVLSFSVHSRAVSFEEYAFDPSRGQTDVLIVMKDNKIIYERYANGYNFNRPHILHSLNKLFLNAFIGHLEKKKIISSTAPIKTAINDAYTSQLTVDSLMRMSSGIRTISDPDAIETIEPGIIRPIENIPENTFEYHLLKGLPLNRPHSDYNYGFYDNNLLIQYLENRFGEENLKSMLADFFSQFGFHQTHFFIQPSNRYLYANQATFLNSVLLKYNNKDKFQLSVSKQSAISSARDILALTKLYLENDNSIFSQKWRDDSLSCDVKHFIKSRKTRTFYSPFAYGRYWFLNKTHLDGFKAYMSLPESLVLIQGLRGQTVAIFPDQKLIYLRLAKDGAGSSFNREEHLNLLYKEFIKADDS